MADPLFQTRAVKMPQENAPLYKCPADAAAATRRLRILFLSNDIAYLYNFRGPLIRAFRDKGYEVLAVAPPTNPVIEANLRALRVDFEGWNLRKTGRNPVEELRSILNLVSIFRRFRPDIFFGYTIKPVIYGTLISYALGVQRRVVMITGLGYAFLPGEGITKTLIRQIVFIGYRLALKRSSLVIFQNQDDIDLFRQLCLLSSRIPVTKVNGSGVDIHYFAATPLPPGPPRFLLVARLLRDKGIYEFIEAARVVKRKLPKAQFVLVGKADSNPAAVPSADLETWTAEGIVEYRGYLDDPYPEFCAAHVFVLPSYREGTPRTCLEAMSSGRAIITTDVPGCRETVLEGENGLLVPARDAAALADAMWRLAENLELAGVMGGRGRRIAEERFDLRKVAEYTVNLIEGHAT